jgi:hypothetical protein
VKPGPRRASGGAWVDLSLADVGTMTARQMQREIVSLNADTQR